MIKAIEFEILRGVRSSGRVLLPVARQPARVATLIDEAGFREDHLLSHNRNVFLEDRVFHDWIWKDGALRYYSRVAEVADVVVAYVVDDV